MATDILKQVTALYAKSTPDGGTEVVRLEDGKEVRDAFHEPLQQVVEQHYPNLCGTVGVNGYVFNMQKITNAGLADRGQQIVLHFEPNATPLTLEVSSKSNAGKALMKACARALQERRTRPDKVIAKALSDTSLKQPPAGAAIRTLPANGTPPTMPDLSVLPRTVGTNNRTPTKPLGARLNPHSYGPLDVKYGR